MNKLSLCLQHLIQRFLTAISGFTLLGLMIAIPGFAEETITAYNSYNSVPFVVDQGGLATDLVGYLNGKLKGKYHLQLNTTTRERLNQTIQTAENNHDTKAVFLFLNPSFINDTDKKKFHWTPPIMPDANIVISTAQRKIEYQSPASLQGLRFGAIHGNRYAGLEDQFGKNITRDNVNEELSNIKKIASGKIDVTIMASSTYRYLLKQLGNQSEMKNLFYVATKPQSSFERFIFLNKDQQVLGKELDTVISGMRSDPVWKAILQKYAIE
ncbi:substrate-binding periplasmic protein [Undibacterium sp. SXout7W]|uniref:substrate-binding periplasmic protein n=1 Tax=Undibacterium sp. SXout7W TaxID=3413049 RepID=UPI003BF00705